MKTFLAVTAGMLALAAVPAGAADLGLPAKAPVPVYNWTGCYFGGNVGYGNGQDRFTTSTTFGAGLPTVFSDTIKSNGFFGGGQAGCNYELPSSFVFGIEADGDWSDIHGSTNTFNPANSVYHNFELEDFGTVRGRFGYAWNNVFVYGTGGWAWGEDKVQATITASAIGFAGASVTNTTDLSGWVAGAGLEVGLLNFPGWTVRLEYLHLEFDNVHETFNFGAIRTLSLISHSTSTIDVDTLRIGVNYLFNFGPAPIVTRY